MHYKMCKSVTNLSTQTLAGEKETGRSCSVNELLPFASSLVEG